MKDHPIIFSAEMVCAILEGRKTQTRRIIKSAQDARTAKYFDPSQGNWPIDQGTGKRLLCPYGQIGMRLWVRETWQAYSTGAMMPYNLYCPITRQSLGTKSYLPAQSRDFDLKNPPPTGWWMYYRATDDLPNNNDNWMPSIFMPRWASRLTLEIASVRVERVQSITEADAKAVGIRGFTDNLGSRHSNPIMIYPAFPDRDGGFLRARDAFEALWNSINTRRGYGWDTNPWVWVIEFKVVE